MADEKKMQLIKSLLEKARRTTGSESEAFAARATALMAQYGVEEAMLEDAAGPDGGELICRRVRFVAPYLADKATLFSSISNVFACKGVWRRADETGKKGERILSVYGYRSDIDRALMLFASLNLHMARELRVAPGPREGEHRATYNRSFMAGYAATVHNRLLMAQREATVEAGPTATGRSADLVLVNRAKRVELFRDQHGKPGKARVRRYSGSGWDAGDRAGQRADIGGNRIGNANRNSLGAA